MFQVVSRPGLENILADALSRNSINKQEPIKYGSVAPLLVTTNGITI